MLQKRLGNPTELKTHQTEDVKCSLVDLVPTIRDYTDHHLLPSIRSPGFGLVSAAKVGNVLDDTTSQNKNKFQNHQKFNPLTRS